MEEKLLNNSHTSTKQMKNWLDWLSSYTEQHPKLGIAKLQALASELKLINWDIPVITVAGTNGKGSTVIAIESQLLDAGLQVGSFISPHLRCFSERFRINAVNPQLDELAEYFLQVNAYQLSFFETCTFMALLLFKRAKVDVIILEVGLGGRLDATNIVNNDIAVITSIGLDHTELLGDTVLQIAKEKSGIIKPGKHVVVGLVEDPIYQVIEQSAKDQHATIARVSKVDVVDIKQQNLATASLAIEALQGILKSIEFRKAAIFSSRNFSGRAQYEQYAAHRLVLDVAHNPAAAQWLHQNLQSDGFTPSIAVVNFAKNKDWLNSAMVFNSLIEHWYVMDTDSPRLQQATYLANEMGQKLCGEVSVIRDLDFLEQDFVAKNVLVFGSFIVVGKVLDIIQHSK